MRESDTPDFVTMLCDVWALSSKTPTEGQAAMFIRALAAYTLDDVRRAFDAHVKDPQRGRFAPLPADLIAQIEGGADDGRPGPEEAWAIALGAADEHATVVWTDEIAAAWAIAKPVFAIGDEVGARMAFREAYTRMVADERKRRQPAVWRASLGFDKDARRAAIEAAVDAGRLDQTELQALPAPETGDALLLAGPVRTPAAERARQALRELADEMRNRKDDVLLDTSERDAMNARKAALDAEVKDYMRDSDAA